MHGKLWKFWMPATSLTGIIVFLYLSHHKTWWTNKNEWASERVIWMPHCKNGERWMSSALQSCWCLLMFTLSQIWPTRRLSVFGSMPTLSNSHEIPKVGPWEGWTTSPNKDGWQLAEQAVPSTWLGPYLWIRKDEKSIFSTANCIWIILINNWTN